MGFFFIHRCSRQCDFQVIMDPTIRQTLFNFFVVTFPHLLVCFRHYEKLLISASNKRLQLQFLKDCLQEQVVPRSFRPSLFRQHHDPFPDSARHLLKETCKYVKLEIDEAYYRLRRQTSALKQNLPSDLFNTLCAIAKQKCDIENRKTSANLNKKLSDLCNRSVWNNCDVPGSILSLSSCFKS